MSALYITCTLFRSVSHLRDIIQALNDDSTALQSKGELELNLVGHSMGGSICLLYARYDSFCQS